MTIEEARPAAGGAFTAARNLLARPAVLYALVTPFAFGILEMLLLRQRGLQYSLDVLDSDLPVLDALRDDWLRFGPSLWDPHLTSGNASLVQLALPPITPDFILSFVIPLFLAYFLTYAVLIWSAGVGMHLFLRDSVRLGTAACVLGAVIYLFSFWHYIHGFAVPLLPLMLWLTDRWATASTHRWRWSLALVALGTFQLYVGLLQLAAIVAAFQLAYLVIVHRRSGRIRRLTAEWVGIWAACGLLFAPVALSQLVYLSGSHRVVWGTGSSAPDAVLRSAVEQTVALFANTVVAVPVAGVLLGTAAYAGTFFIGTLPLVLLVIGLFRPRDTRGRLLLGLLIAVPLLYLASILVEPIQSQLGILKSFQLGRVSHLFPFVLAANAAIGADAVFRGELRTIFRGRIRMASVVVLLGFLGVEAVASALQVRVPGTSRHEDIGWLLSAAAMGGGVLLGAALLIRAGRSPIGLPLGSAVLLVVLLASVGERAIYARGERYLHGGLGTYAAAMAVDPGFAFIRRQSGNDLERTLTAGLPTNRAVVSGRYEAGGYQSVYPLTYHELFGVLTDPFLDTSPRYWAYYHRWGNRAFAFGPAIDAQVANLMGIRWVWSRGFEFDDPQLVERFRQGSTFVYENTAVFPRAFVVGKVRSFASEAELLDGIAAADDAELRDAAFVLDGEQPPIATDPQGEATATAAIERYTPDRIDIQVEASAPSLLILTDAFAPGWTATACGADAPIYRADVAYRAVAVPAGPCTVTFRYQPWFTYLGFAAAGATLLALLGFLALMASRERRRPTLDGDAGAEALPDEAAAPTDDPPGQAAR